jgi:hypothetical protein
MMGRRMPKGTWKPRDLGLYNSKKILRYLMMQILGLKEEEIREFPFTVTFFREHGLYTPLVKIHGAISKYVRMAFPDLSRGMTFPGPGGRWAPFPWRGNIIQITKEVMDGGWWPEGFWTREGYFHRARIVDHYLRSHHGIDLENLDMDEAVSLRMDEVRGILYE